MATEFQTVTADRDAWIEEVMVRTTERDVHVEELTEQTAERYGRIAEVEQLNTRVTRLTEKVGGMREAPGQAEAMVTSP